MEYGFGESERMCHVYENDPFVFGRPCCTTSIAHCKPEPTYLGYMLAGLCSDQGNSKLLGILLRIEKECPLNGIRVFHI